MIKLPLHETNELKLMSSHEQLPMHVCIFFIPTACLHIFYLHLFDKKDPKINEASHSLKNKHKNRDKQTKLSQNFLQSHQ